MTETEFLEKYGDQTVSMLSLFKHSVDFSNDEVIVSGTPYYRGEIHPVMTITELYEEVEDFSFSLKTKLLQ